MNMQRILPPSPGRDRRLAYGELVRQRNNGSNSVHTRQSILRRVRGNPVFVEIELVGMTLEQLLKVSKLSTNTVVSCAICQDDTINKDIVRKLKCGHTFHAHCIDRWLSKSRQCPYCRCLLENYYN